LGMEGMHLSLLMQTTLFITFVAILFLFLVDEPAARESPRLLTNKHQAARPGEGMVFAY
jgi:hypothetical protein